MKNNKAQLFFDFLNDTEFNTDPIYDDTKKTSSTSAYTRKTTDAQRKAINKNNLQQKQNELFFSANTLDATPRIITDIRPINQFCNILPKTYSRIISGIKIEAPTENTAEYYLQHGTAIKDIIQNETQKLDAMNALEKWKLSKYRSVIGDFCYGLMKLISTGNYFDGLEPQFIERNGQRIITSWLVRMNWQQIKKATFGGLVDKDGNYLRGTSEILKHTTEKDLINFITQTIPPALLQYFSKTPNGFYSIGEYAPIRIVDRNGEHIILELDRRYFPFDFNDRGEPDGISKNCRYLLSIAGFSSVLEIGHYQQTRKGLKDLPNTISAYRFLQTVGSAFQFQSLLGVSLKNTYTDKENVAVRKNGIYTMLGADSKEKQITQIEAQKNWTENRISAEISINKKDSVLTDLFQRETEKRNFKEIQRKVKLIGDMLVEGLKFTGIDKELKNSPFAKDILIPSNKTGMQFVEQYKNLLLVKVEPIKNIL